MGYTQNYSFYKPERKDKFDVIGYGVGNYNEELGKSDFAKKFELASNDKTTPLLSYEYFNSKFNEDEKEVINESSDYLKKEIITDEISSATNLAITSKPVYDLYQQFYKDINLENNGNISVNDKLFIKITKDVGAYNYDGLNRILFNGEYYYFTEEEPVQSARHIIFYKTGINKGRNDLISTGFFGYNIAQNYSTYHKKNMYYSVYDNIVYYADSPIVEETNTIELNDGNFSKLHVAGGVIFLEKFEDTNSCNLCYSADGNEFKTIDLSAYNFVVEDIQAFYYSGNYVLTNKDNKVILLDSKFNVVESFIQSVNVEGQTALVTSKYAYSSSKKAFYCVALIGEDYYMLKTYDFKKFYNETKCDEAFTDIIGCGGCIFSAYKQFLYIYNENVKKFLKIHFFNQETLYVQKSASGLNFNKHNLCPVARLYLFEDDIKSLNEIAKDFGDRII